MKTEVRKNFGVQVFDKAIIAEYGFDEDKRKEINIEEALRQTEINCNLTLTEALEQYYCEAKLAIMSTERTVLLIELRDDEYFANEVVCLDAMAVFKGAILKSNKGMTLTEWEEAVR